MWAVLKKNPHEKLFGATSCLMIYTPRPTKFLQIAAARGLKVIDGLEMLIHQGAIGLEFWLDQPVPIEIMRQALIQHLSVFCESTATIPQVGGW